MLNKLISSLAIARQSAQGAPATAPEYVLPLAGSGAVAGVDPKVTIDEETGQSYAINAYVEEVASGFDAPVRAYPKALGLLLYGLFGTCVTTEGTKGGTYVHAFTVDPVSQAVPWFTLWGNIEDECVRSHDSKVGSLELSFDGNKPLEVASTLACLGVLFGGGAQRPAGGVDMAGLKYFTPANCSFKMDAAGATLQARKVTKFGLKMTRNVNPEYFSGSPLPSELSMGKFEAAPSFTLKPDDLDDFRKAVTGSAAGTSVSADVITGSYELLLSLGDFSLKVEGSKVPWKIAWPKSDAGGGAVELEVSADNQLGTATASPIKVTLVNDVQSYAS